MSLCNLIYSLCICTYICVYAFAVPGDFNCAQVVYMYEVLVLWWVMNDNFFR